MAALVANQVEANPTLKKLQEVYTKDDYDMFDLSPDQEDDEKILMSDQESVSCSIDDGSANNNMLTTHQNSVKSMSSSMLKTIKPTRKIFNTKRKVITAFEMQERPKYVNAIAMKAVEKFYQAHLIN